MNRVILLLLMGLAAGVSLAEPVKVLLALGSHVEFVAIWRPILCHLPAGWRMDIRMPNNYSSAKMENNILNGMTCCDQTALGH